MSQVSVLDGLFLYSLPSLAKVSIIEVKSGYSDQFISKEVIVIISIDLHNWGSWEIYDKIITFVEFWGSCIQLIIFLLIEFFLTTCYIKIGIRGRKSIFLCKVESLKHIKSYFTLCDGVQPCGKLCIEQVITQMLINLELLNSRWFYIIIS